MTPTSVSPRRSISGVAAASRPRAAARIASVCGGCVGQRVRPRRAREVAEAQPEHEGAADPSCGPHPPGDAIDEGDHRGVDLRGGSRRAPERALRGDRAAAAARLHRSRIAVVGERVQVPAGAAPEHQHEGPPPGAARPRRPFRSRRAWSLAAVTGADAPEPLDRERVEERELAVRRDQEQAVRLGDAARHLGEELRPGDADGDRQADTLAYVVPQPCRDLGGRARDPLHPAHVEKRLVDREPLDERGRVVEHPEHRLARLGVGRHARRDHRSPRGTAAVPALRPSRCGRRRPSPRSWRRARPRRRRSRAGRAGEDRRAARPKRRTSRGRRGGSSPSPCERMFAHDPRNARPFQFRR